MTRDAAVGPSESPLASGRGRMRNAMYRGYAEQVVLEAEVLADMRIA